MFIIPPFNNVDPSSLIALAVNSFLIELKIGKSRSDGLEIRGDQKVARVARGFRVPVKIFSKKCQKTSHTTY